MSAWNKRLWLIYFAKALSHLKNKRWKLMRLWHRHHERQGPFRPSTPFDESALQSPKAARPAMQGLRRNALIPKLPLKQRSLQSTKPNQDEVLHELWIVMETVTEIVIVHGSETTVVTGAQTPRAEDKVGRGFKTDVIEAALELDKIGPAQGLSETSVLLEAALVPSMITMSEADLEDANAVAPDPG